MTDQIVLLLSGPNLNLLGQREPEIYGTASLDDHIEAATKRASEHGLDLDAVQSNHEGEIVDAIQAARKTHDAIVIDAPRLEAKHAWAALRNAAVNVPVIVATVIPVLFTPALTIAPGAIRDDLISVVDRTLARAACE